jgi:Tfp pilus assembly PilM family ATPase
MAELPIWRRDRKPAAQLEADGDATKECGARAARDGCDYQKIVVPAGQREEDLVFQVENEASQYIPFPLDEVDLDRNVGENPS